jgi:hypothetical protein
MGYICKNVFYTVDQIAKQLVQIGAYLKIGSALQFLGLLALLKI